MPGIICELLYANADKDDEFLALCHKAIKIFILLKYLYFAYFLFSYAWKCLKRYLGQPCCSEKVVCFKEPSDACSFSVEYMDAADCSSPSQGFEVTPSPEIRRPQLCKYDIAQPTSGKRSCPRLKTQCKPFRKNNPTIPTCYTSIENIRISVRPQSVSPGMFRPCKPSAPHARRCARTCPKSRVKRCERCLKQLKTSDRRKKLKDLIFD